MKSISPFFKKTKPEYFLVLDIGTETIKTLICSEFVPSSVKTGEKESKKIIIHGATTQYFDKFGVFDTTDFERETLKKTISRTIKEIQRIREVKRDRLFLGLPANILRGRVVSQNFKRENPEKIISQIEKNQIQKSVFDKVKTKLSKKFAQKLNLLPQDFHFSNLKILGMKIDGYEVPSIQGLKGKNLDFKVLAIFLSRHYLKKIEEVCQSFNFKISKVVHPAENLPFLFGKKKIDAVLLDVGGELTKVFLLEKGELKGISEFEAGGADFTQKLSEFLGMNLQRSRVLKHNYSQSLLSRPIQKRIREILSDETQNWSKILKRTFKKFSKKLLPSNIFLFGGGSLLPEIPETLKKDEWKSFSFVVGPKVKQILPKDLRNIENKTKSLNSPQQISSLLISYG